MFVLRLGPGADLKRELEGYVMGHGVNAGVILTCVGSVSGATLRFAGKSEGQVIEGDLEIVSLTGTLGCDGMHIHLAVSDATGQTVGGHLLEGCIVRTTAEVAIGELAGVRFTREMDAQTGYRELRIEEIE